MTSKITWLLVGQLRKVWVRVVSFALLAVATVGASQVIGTRMPEVWMGRLSRDAIDQLLGIMASSMLAVTTFSLSVAVSAFSAAAQAATPRATALLQQDPTTQNVLATFLGAFIFSLVGLVALKAGFYTREGEFVLFAATALVVLFVVVAFLRWISHLMTFGRVEDTLDRVEEAAASAISVRLENPFLGGRPWEGDPPEESVSVLSSATGYVQHIDVELLSRLAKQTGSRIWVRSLPGCFVHQSTSLAQVEGPEISEETEAMIRTAFTCGKQRTFDQDPEFGLIVLSEIASRALSPGVNDPGTATDVIGRLIRVLSSWEPEQEQLDQHQEVLVPAVHTDTLLETAFNPIIRDAGKIFEVHARIQMALDALSAAGSGSFANQCAELSRHAIEAAKEAGIHEREIETLRRHT